VAAGEVVDPFGYNVSLLALGAAARTAFLAFLVRMPETRGLATSSRTDAAAAAFEAGPCA
jgi:hypothetical protein